MKFLLVNLSDIHLESKCDAKTINNECFKNCLKIKCADHEEIIFVLNGDLTNHGSNLEFTNFSNHLNELLNFLKTEFPKKNVSIITTPGNHDCYLPEEDRLSRKEHEIKVQRIRNNNDLTEFINYKDGINSQKNYKIFRDKYSNGNIVNQSRFFDQYLYKFENLDVNIVSINSSYAFDINMKQGEVFIDYEEFYKQVFMDNNRLNILISHYPIEWFDRTMLEDINHIQKNFDLLIFGHEHDGDILKKDYLFTSQMEIKNPKFRSTGDIFSGFSTVSIDTKALSMRSELIVKRDSIYTTKHYQDFKLVSKPFYSNRIVSVNNNFGKMIKNFDDLIMNKENVLFEDIFIPLPLKNLEEIKEIEKDNCDSIVKYLNSDEIDLSEFDILSFYGGQQSGKSTLLINYFKKVFMKNLIPIIIKGSTLNRKITEENLNQILQNEFKNQYLDDKEVLITNKDKVCILIDDINEINSLDSFKSCIDFFLKDNYRIIFSSLISYINRDAKEFEHYNIKQYQIQNLGQTEIYGLCEKWLGLKGENSQISHQILITLKKNINMVASKSYVPLNPFFVLMLLRANDELRLDELVDATKKTYYEYLISTSVLNISNKIELTTNQIETILEELAYQKYINKKIDFKNFRNYMGEIYDSSESYDERLVELKKLMIIHNMVYQNGNIIEFKYSYMYYTFLAKYIAKNVTKELIDLNYLIANIFEEENSNIMLFLAQYVAKDTVINFIINETDNIFKEYNEIIFDKEDLKIYNLFIQGVRNVTQYGSLSENNKKLNKQIDKVKRERRETKCENGLSEEFKEFLKAFNITMIINELLNSYNNKVTNKKLFEASIKMNRRLLSRYTLQYQDEIRTLVRKHKNGDEFPEEVLDIELVKKATNLFLSLVVYQAEHLGSSVNYNCLAELAKADEVYLRIVKFVNDLKFSGINEELINLGEVKSLVKLFDKDNNKLGKGLIYSLLNYQINYKGLPARKTVEICNMLNMENKDVKRILSKNMGYNANE